MQQSLNWMTIKDRVDFHRLCLMYNCKNGLTLDYMSGKLTTVSNIHSYSSHSRGCHDMATVKPNNNQQKRTF